VSRPEDAAGVPARRAALSLLDAVLRKGLPLEAALDIAARPTSDPRPTPVLSLMPSRRKPCAGLAISKR
jgi:16S rRNA (cytosine967-C5)-methyltransferase